MATVVRPGGRVRNQPDCQSPEDSGALGNGYGSQGNGPKITGRGYKQ